MKGDGVALVDEGHHIFNIGKLLAQFFRQNLGNGFHKMVLLSDIGTISYHKISEKEREKIFLDKRGRQGYNNWAEKLGDKNATVIVL